MFTGIIETQGRVVGIETIGECLVLLVDLNGLNSGTIKVGDSIAINGACLTVTRMEGGIGRFDVSPETLNKCLMASWKEGDWVNLEPALTLSKPLGGHLILGHVDGAGTINEVIFEEKSKRLNIRVPGTLGRYLAARGSVAVDGVSLTTTCVRDLGNDTLFGLTLVPHTLAVTTLENLSSGDRVHIEVDMLARYLDRLLISGFTHQRVQP